MADVSAETVADLEAEAKRTRAVWQDLVAKETVAYHAYHWALCRFMDAIPTEQFDGEADA